MVEERVNIRLTNEHGGAAAKGLAPNDLDHLPGWIDACRSPST